MIEETPPDVGRRIRMRREQRGLSLRILAERSGLSVNAVSLIEGRQSSPTVVTLHRLAEALGVRIVDLLGTGEKAPVIVFRAGEGANMRTGAP